MSCTDVRRFPLTNNVTTIQEKISAVECIIIFHYFRRIKYCSQHPSKKKPFQLRLGDQVRQDERISRNQMKVREVQMNCEALIPNRVATG